MKELLINAKKTAEKISDFLKKEFKKRNKKTAVLAISGGIDSAVSAYLCKAAGLDLYAIILPYNQGGDEGEKVARALKLSESHLLKINIGPLADAVITQIEKLMTLDKLDKGNIMARQRMVVQYAIARKLNGLVVGTENLSEYYLGYFTLHGDQACDISPIAGLFKTQVYQLAEELGVPSFVMEKAPTAGLWPGQTDEGEFGFRYKDADPILCLAFLKKNSKEEIIRKGFDPNLVNKVLERVRSTEFKRESPPKL